MEICPYPVANWSYSYIPLNEKKNQLNTDWKNFQRDYIVKIYKYIRTGVIGHDLNLTAP